MEKLAGSLKKMSDVLKKAMAVPASKPMGATRINAPMVGSGTSPVHGAVSKYAASKGISHGDYLHMLHHLDNKLFSGMGVMYHSAARKLKVDPWELKDHVSQHMSTLGKAASALDSLMETLEKAEKEGKIKLKKAAPEYDVSESSAKDPKVFPKDESQQEPSAKEGHAFGEHIEMAKEKIAQMPPEEQKLIMEVLDELGVELD
jgi:hypothetical protein